MLFSNSLRKFGGYFAAGAATLAIGLFRYEEYQKPNGIFSTSTHSSSAAPFEQTAPTSECSAPAVDAGTGQKSIESEARECFERAKRSQQDLNPTKKPTTEECLTTKKYSYNNLPISSSPENALQANPVPEATSDGQKKPTDEDKSAIESIMQEIEQPQDDRSRDDKGDEDQKASCRGKGDEKAGDAADDDEEHEEHDSTDINDEDRNVEVNASDDEADDDDDLLEQFRPVIGKLNFRKLEQFALVLRLHLLQSLSDVPIAFMDLLKISCRIAEEPMAGAYNLAYAITFSDGVTWIARVPGHGTPSRFGELDARKLDIEYQTMRYIKANTTIPIPEVFHWETSCNRVGAPFALMAWVPGKALCGVWDEKLDDQQRFKVLSSLAGYMSQFQKLSFDRLGMLDFDASGQVKEVGAQILLLPHNFVAWYHTKAVPSSTKAGEVFEDLLREAEEEDTDPRHRANVCLMQIAVASIPAYLINEQRFALTPIDFNYQNILVDSETKITGLIDWDGVQTGSSCSGYARYPSWITRDWDPVMYDYDEATGTGAEESPQKLSTYRQYYAAEFHKIAANFDGYDPRMTTVSHIMEALCIALTVPMARSPIIEKLLDHAFDGTPPFTRMQYANAFVAENTTAKDALIKEAFATMWHAEWESPSDGDKGHCELSDTGSTIAIVTTDSNSNGNSEMSSKDNPHPESPTTSVGSTEFSMEEPKITQHESAFCAESEADRTRSPGPELIQPRDPEPQQRQKSQLFGCKSI